MSPPTRGAIRRRTVDGSIRSRPTIMSRAAADATPSPNRAAMKMVMGFRS